jgi:hypothetical protein
MDASDANAESSPADLVSLDSAAVFDESKLRNRPSRPKITPSQALFSISSALLFVRFPRGSLPALPTQSDRTHSIHLCLQHILRPFLWSKYQYRSNGASKCLCARYFALYSLSVQVKQCWSRHRISFCLNLCIICYWCVAIPTKLLLHYLRSNSWPKKFYYDHNGPLVTNWITHLSLERRCGVAASLQAAAFIWCACFFS